MAYFTLYLCVHKRDLQINSFHGIFAIKTAYETLAGIQMSLLNC